MFDLEAWQGFKNFVLNTFIGKAKIQKKIFISDTTLRDGEQSTGASLGIEQKVRIAKQLEELGVDSIQAGFPASNRIDFEAVRRIAQEVKRPVISALSRCRKEDIEITAEAFRGVKQWSLNLFLGTSELLRKYSLNKTKEEIIQTLTSSVKYGRTFTDRVTFGAEDATRTEIEFLYQVYEKAIDAGATVIGFPDTVGWLIPEQVKQMIERIKQNVPNFNKALLAVHFHNDLGLAVANSLAAIEAGVDIVQCTVNGLGERAGNTSLEELIMALRVRQDYYNISISINTQELYKTSQLVAELTGIAIPVNKPIVGDNVFASESGIHQAALLKNISTYQIINPLDIGREGVKIILGKHSGKQALVDRLQKLGFQVSGNEHHLEEIYKRFKELAISKKQVYDEELFMLADGILRRL